MTQHISRRAVLKTGAGALAAGWLWTAGAPLAMAQADGHDSGAPWKFGVLDEIILGDATSETAHATSATLSDIVTGGLGLPARVFNPNNPVSYWGGTASFTMACAPTGTTYVTIKL